MIHFHCSVAWPFNFFYCCLHLATSYRRLIIFSLFSYCIFTMPFYCVYEYPQKIDLMLYFVLLLFDWEACALFALIFSDYIDFWKSTALKWGEVFNIIIIKCFCTLKKRLYINVIRKQILSITVFISLISLYYITKW